MKSANNAPVYASIYAEIAEEFRNHGYALAIHGSLIRDFDLIAIPWIEKPSTQEQVLNDIKGKFSIEKIIGPNTTLHNRICYTLVMGWGNYSIDLSFMPANNENS